MTSDLQDSMQMFRLVTFGKYNIVQLVDCQIMQVSIVNVRNVNVFIVGNIRKWGE